MLKHQTHRRFSVPSPRWGLIGHRGLAALAPENTLASFEAAAQAGFNWVEFDLRLTKDNVLVIFHDDALDRTTNGDGLIAESDWRYLKTLNAGGWFHPYFRRERIPLFEAILPKLLEMGLYLNIELKTPPDPTPFHCKNLVQGLISVLQQHWPKNTPLPLISSFNTALLAPIREAFPDMPLGYLTETLDTNLIEQIAAQDNCALHCDYHLLTPELIQHANALELPLLAFTVNDPKVGKQLISEGLFAVFTDHPLNVTP